MKPVRWGILGVGDVCEVKSGPSFQKAPGSELRAVMRRNADMARDFARRHGVPQWFGDADELLATPEIDAVYVCTPPVHHLDLAKAALAAGKHVYLEKPMAMNAAQCREIIDAESASGLKVAVAHYRRMMPAFRKVGELLKEGAIGTPRSARVCLMLPDKSGMIASSETSWRMDPAISGGGLFHDLAPHQLDLMRVYFGESVWYQGSSKREPANAACDTRVTAAVRFESGVEFEGLWNFNASPESEREECVITGDQGAIRFSFFGGEINVESRGTNVKLTFDALAHVQQPMIEAVNDFIRGDAACPCTTEDGLRVMEMIDAFTTNRP